MQNRTEKIYRSTKIKERTIKGKKTAINATDDVEVIAIVAQLYHYRQIELWKNHANLSEKYFDISDIMMTC